MNYIVTNTPENNNYFLLFKCGDTAGLKYVYDNLYRPISFYGRQILEDSFEVDTILQDSFLRAWEFRGRITSMLHLFRFIRMSVRWGCYGYLSERRSKFQRCLVPLERIENSGLGTYDPDQEDGQERWCKKDLECLALIEDAIPYLPADKQIVLKHYLDNKCTHREIGERFAASYQHISTEIQESIAMLRSMLVAPQPKLQSIDPLVLRNHSLLTEGQVLVYNLRHHQKYSFDRIAQEMNIPLTEAISQYVSANKTLKIHENSKKHCYA